MFKLIEIFSNIPFLRCINNETWWKKQAFSAHLSVGHTFLCWLSLDFFLIRFLLSKGDGVFPGSVWFPGSWKFFLPPLSSRGGPAWADKEKVKGCARLDLECGSACRWVCYWWIAFSWNLPWRSVGNSRKSGAPHHVNWPPPEWIVHDLVQVGQG